MDAPNKYMKREDTDKTIALEKDDVVKLVKWKLYTTPPIFSS
jgi:hypothetical protein